MAQKSLGSISPYGKMEPFTEEGKLNAVIETPQGIGNKYKYDSDLGIFKLDGTLPLGSVFPFDFGFVPSTVGDDGDPLDVLVLMEEPAFPGCLVEARLVGIINAEQTEKTGEVVRNDRLIAVIGDSRVHKDVTSIDQLPATLLEDIEHFFVSYNQPKGKKFKPLGREGADKAVQVVKAAQRKAKSRTK